MLASLRQPLWWRQTVRSSGPVRDALFLLVLVVLVVLPYLVTRKDGPFGDTHVSQPTRPTWSIVLPICAVLALSVRRRWPLLTLGWTVAAGIAATALTADPGPAALPIMVALYSLVFTTSGQCWRCATGLTAVVVVGAAIVMDPARWYQSLFNLIWIALPPTLAEAVRNRRAYLTEVEERARRAEETREEEARRQVAEERVRIARELHDVLAHSIAVVNVQSGVAAHIIDQNPGEAKQALWHIHDASHAALSELRATLDLLRQDGDPAAPTTPMPGLAEMDELTDAVRAAGLDVRTRLNGDPTVASPEAGLVAYRVMQEALTNVLKHANASAVDVDLLIQHGNLTVEIRDDGVGSTDPPPLGHGRMGMRERVLALGGVIDDGPTHPGYRVSATLPVTLRSEDTR